MIVYSTGYNRMKCILYVHIFRYHYIYFKLHLTLNCLVLLFCKMIYMSLLLYRDRNQTSTWETHLILDWVWTLKCSSVHCLKWTLDAGQMCCWCELETSVRRRHVLTSSVLNCASFFLYDDDSISRCQMNAHQMILVTTHSQKQRTEFTTGPYCYLKQLNACWF